VLGMIQAFRDLEMAEGAANAALLASRAEAAVAEIETTIGRILAFTKEKASK